MSRRYYKKLPRAGARRQLIFRLAPALIALVLLFPFQASSPSAVFAASEDAVVATDVALPFSVSGDLEGSYATLTAAIAAVNSDAGATYAVTAQQDDTISNLAVNKTVLLSSAPGTTMTITNTVGARHFTVNATGALTLKNITLQGTTQTTGNTPAGGINVLAKGQLIMESGATIRGVSPASAATSYAQGAAVQCAGSLIMKDGLITDNRFSYVGGAGAGVYLTGAGASFMLSGGSITNNTAAGGAGVYCGAGVVFTMTGGTISGNTTTTTGNTYGGGVSLTGAGTSFTMQGGSITGNNALVSGSYVAYGGGVYGGPSATLILNGGTIDNNNATTEGGGLYANGSSVTINGGLISANSAGSGGGVSIGSSASSKFALNGGDFVGNQANTFGGGLYMQESGTITLSGASFRNNKCTLSGGGLCIGGPLNVTMNALVFDGNTAANGGGFFVPVTDPVAISNTVFSNNTASQGGGAIWSTSGTAQNLTIDTTVVFYGNTAPLAYPPPANVLTLCPKITTTSSSIYGHPLNNYDINYVGGTAGVVVTVYYVDRNNQPVGSPSIALYAIPRGSSFSLSEAQIPTISSYSFADWKIGTDRGPQGNTEVSLASVSANTTLYLIFDDIAQIAVSVPVKLMFAAFQDDNGAISAPDYYLQNNGTTPVDVMLKSFTVDVTGDLVLASDPAAPDELGLKLQGCGATPFFKTTDWLTPGTTDLALGTLAENGQAGDRGDFTLVGYYGGDFLVRKTPRYLATFEFTVSP